MTAYRLFPIGLLLLGRIAAAQTSSAPLPSAPTAAPIPAAAPSSKPSFAVPPPVFSVPKGPAAYDASVRDPRSEDTCYAPPEGIYTRQGNHIPTELKGEVNGYMREVMTRINGEWIHHLSVAEKNAWAKGRKLAVRFAIFPDGSYDEPKVTVSSGSPSDDAHAVAAIQHISYPPPPAGLKRPLLICMRFGYSTEPFTPTPGAGSRWGGLK